MNYFENIDWLKMRHGWVSYFDLLGFSSTVSTGWPAVVTIYSQCLDGVRYRYKRDPPPLRFGAVNEDEDENDREGGAPQG
jgi:hypothetical protein